MDAEVLLSAIFRDSTEEGRSQFVKIWFLPANLPDWLLPDLRIYPITKGTVTFTFRRLPPRDLKVTVNMEKKTFQYLGGSGKAALKTLIKKAIDDPGYEIHGHMVIVQLDDPLAHDIDRLRMKITPQPDIGQGDVGRKPSNTVKQGRDIVPSINTGNNSLQLYKQPLYLTESLERMYGCVPGPFSVENIIPSCGLMKKSTSTLPFAKLLGLPVMKPEIAATETSALALDINTELAQQSADSVFTPDKNHDTKKMTSKQTSEPVTKCSKKGISWFAWGLGVLKDAGVI